MFLDNLVTIRGSPDQSRKLIAEKLLAFIPRPCRRILMIHPQTIPKEDFILDRILNRRCWTYQPYGLGLLCKALGKKGYTTDLLDLNLEMTRFACQKRENFNYDFWKHRLNRKIGQFKPDLIAVSCMFTMTHNITKQITEQAKTINPHIPVIAGGVHITNAGRLVLKDCPEIDFIGLFECDVSFPDLLDFVNGKLPAEKIAQIATMIDGQYVALETRITPSTQEIDASPDYRDLPIALYDRLGQIGTYGFMRPGRPAASLLSARGCRAHCSFCSVASFNGPGVRLRSIKNVVDEIEFLTKKHRIKHITWLDDDLLFNKQRALELFKEITKRNLGITWDASNGLIAAAITPEIMEVMANSGCIGFNLGIESGNSDILHSMHKPGTINSFRKAKKLIDKHPHIFIKGFLIIGFPDETLRQMLDTMNLSLELGFDWYAVQLLNLLPSTEIYQSMMEQGLIRDNLGTSNVAFVFGPHGRQRLREEREKLNAEDFMNLFNICGLDSVPEQKDLGDCWFLMDYFLNYQIILGLKDEIKLQKKAMMLDDICERIAPENPLAHLFRGIINQKFGQNEKAQERTARVEQLVAGSQYWKKRFDALGLYQLLTRLKQKEFPRLF